MWGEEEYPVDDHYASGTEWVLWKIREIPHSEIQSIGIMLGSVGRNLLHILWVWLRKILTRNTTSTNGRGNWTQHYQTLHYWSTRKCYLIGDFEWYYFFHNLLSELVNKPMMEEVGLVSHWFWSSLCSKFYTSIPQQTPHQEKMRWDKSFQCSLFLLVAVRLTHYTTYKDVSSPVIILVILPHTCDIGGRLYGLLSKRDITSCLSDPSLIWSM